MGSINLLEWLAAHRQPRHLLDLQFIVKGYNSGTADGRDTQGQARGKGEGLPGRLRAPLAQHLHMFPNPEVLPSLPVGF